MLKRGQEIIFYKDNKEISKVTSANFDSLPMGIKIYLGYEQPITKPGSDFFIPLPEKNDYSHLEDIQSVERIKEEDGEGFIFQVHNARYKVKYININLEKLIRRSGLDKLSTLIMRRGIDFPE